MTWGLSVEACGHSCSMWDLGSATRNGTWAPALQQEVLSTGLLGKTQEHFNVMEIIYFDYDGNDVTIRICKFHRNVRLKR